MSHILWVCVAKNLGWCKNRGHPPSQALGLRMHSMHEDWSMVRKQKRCPSWAPTDSLNTWDTPPQQMTVHGLARWLRIWHKIPWKLHKSRNIEAPKDLRNTKWIGIRRHKRCMLCFNYDSFWTPKIRSSDSFTKITMLKDHPSNGKPRKKNWRLHIAWESMRCSWKIRSSEHSDKYPLANLQKKTLEICMYIYI